MSFNITANSGSNFDITLPYVGHRGAYDGLDNNGQIIRGVTITPTVTGAITGFWHNGLSSAYGGGFYNSPVALLYQGTTLIAQGQPTSVTTTGWQQLNFPTGINLYEGVTYTLAVYGAGTSFVQSGLGYTTTPGSNSKFLSVGVEPNGTNAPNPITWGSDTTNKTYLMYVDIDPDKTIHTPTHSTNANLVVAGSDETLSTDLIEFTFAAPIASQTIQHTTDTVKRKQFTASHTTNALKRTANTRTHTTDTLKRKQFTLLHTTSANKKLANNTRTHTTSAVLRKQNAVAHTTNALKRTQTVLTHTTNALKRSLNTRTHTTDALKRTLNTRSHTTSANKRVTGVLRTHTTNALLRKQNALTHTTNALKRTLNTLTHTTNANKRRAYTATHTTSANKKVAGFTVAHTTNANKRVAGNVVIHSTNALIRKAFTLAHTTSANKRTTGILRTHTTNSLLRRIITAAHTTSSNKCKVSTLAHTSDALKRKAYTATHTTDTKIHKVGKIFWVSPANGAVGVNGAEPLVFIIPSAKSDMHFQLQIDTVNTFDSGDFQEYTSWTSQTNWEYYNGSAWVAIPSGGVSPSYAGNQARYTPNLLADDYFRRIRGRVVA